MFDGSIENPLALILLALAFLVGGMGGLFALRGRGGEATSGEAAFGLVTLALLWGVLTPLLAVNRMAGEPLVWIFGREGEDTGVVEYATVLLFLWSALACAWLARRGPTLARWVYAAGAVGAVLIAGEEISWGQWLFHWSTPEAIAAGNLQDETNLHNFLPPNAWELAYAAAGWALIAIVLVMRFAPFAARVDFAPLSVFRRSRFAAPLALTAGILMQHHFVQELSELALAAAAAHALGWTTNRLPARPRMAGLARA